VFNVLIQTVTNAIQLKLISVLLVEMVISLMHLRLVDNHAPLEHTTGIMLNVYLVQEIALDVLIKITVLNVKQDSV
jgi:hypothetical protein